MRILLVGPRWYGHTAAFVFRAAKALGHRVTSIAYRPWPVPPLVTEVERAERLNERVRRHATETAAECVLFLKSEFLSPQTLRHLRKLGATSVAWWFDDPRMWPSFMGILPRLDHFFIFDPAYVGILTRAGAARVEYLPLGFDAQAYLPRATPRQESWDFSFVGSPSAQRILFLSRLKRHKLRIVGPDWSRQAPLLRDHVHAGPTLSPRDTCRLYWATRVAVNLHHPQSKRGLNQRTFELAGSGTFQLVDHKSEAQRLFRLGVELETFRDDADFLNKANYYLSHPDERMEIAARAARRAHAEHTYAHRVRRLLEIVQRG